MRALPIGLMVLGLMGIALVEVISPAPPVNKVVIGVLDFEKSGVGQTDEPLGEKKKVLMKELRRNTRVKLVDIRESCSLSDLKRHGYEKARRYQNIYQLDMILHIFVIQVYSLAVPGDWRCDFGIIDLYTEKVKEVSIETRGIPVELGFRGISRKLLASQDLNRVLREKKKVLAKKEAPVPKEVSKSPEEIEGKKEVSGKKEVTVSREVKESPEEIEGFLIQKGPKLIAQGEYSRVLELIGDLPGKERRHSQIQTLECFANLKGWVTRKNTSCKLRWWALRTELIRLGDNEPTPMLVTFLKDEDPYLRLYAAELLGHIGDERALKDLRAVGESDENRKVRKYSKRAYEQISGEKF